MRAVLRAFPGKVAALALSAVLGACGGGAADAPGSWFDEPTRELGLPAPSGARPDGTYYFPEYTQGGVGLFDHDGDGDLDVFQVRVPPPGVVDRGISNRLFAQQDGHFTDVTEAAGIDAPGYGQALAIGDTDNDGDLDVYVANYGQDTFFRNGGDGTYVEAARAAGFADDWWSTAAAFGDYDADGFLDLFVATYLRYDPSKQCTDASDRRDYCGPRSFNGAPDILYHNEGNGTFRDRTVEAGIVLPQQSARGTGFGVVCLDLTGDGRADFLVANDAQANQLWVNRGDGTFADEAIQRGVALDANGRPEANMGIAVGDPNGDGELDLFITHLWMEHHRLYTGTARALYKDATLESQISRYGLERTGWGCGFFDFDHDGDQDLAIANGAVHRRPPLPGAPAGFWGGYAEPNQLFENDGTGKFSEEKEKAGPFTRQVEVSRGLAFGDLDEDGDVDMVLSNVDNSLRLYRNRAPKEGRHWLLVRALTGKRDAQGAQLWLHAGGRTFRGVVLPGASFASSNDPRVHFGLGSSSTIEEIVVAWPDGRRESFGVPGVDRVVTLRQGEGRVP